VPLFAGLLKDPALTKLFEFSQVRRPPGVDWLEKIGSSPPLIFKIGQIVHPGKKIRVNYQINQKNSACISLIRKSE